MQHSFRHRLNTDPEGLVANQLQIWANKDDGVAKHFKGSVYGMRGKLMKGDPLWWEHFVSMACQEINPGGLLLGVRDGVPRVSEALGEKGFHVLLKDVSTQRRKHARGEFRLAEKRWLHRGATDAVGAIKRMKTESAGGRMLSGGMSHRAWDKMLRHEKVKTEGGYMLGRLPHGAKAPADQPAAVVNQQHLASMAAKGVSTGQFLHQHRKTGKCMLSDDKVSDTSEVVELGQWLNGWAEMMLEAEEKTGRLNIDMQNEEQMCKTYVVDMVLGVDEFPSGPHSIGNATMWLVSSALFKKGQGRPTPAATWNGPEEWAIEVIEAIMKHFWKMESRFTIRAKVGTLWVDLDINVRLFASDNKLFAKVRNLNTLFILFDTPCLSLITTHLVLSQVLCQ